MTFNCNEIEDYISILNKLKEKRKADETLINDFYSKYHFEGSRQFLWSLLKIGFTGNFGELSVFEKENLIDFYENLQQLLGAVYALQQEPVTFVKSLNPE